MKEVICPCSLTSETDVPLPPIKLRYKFMGRVFYIGRYIRWIIENERKEPVYCGWCGNYANGVISGEFLGMKYQIPICKKHIGEQLNPE